MLNKSVSEVTRMTLGDSEINIKPIQNKMSIKRSKKK